MKKIINISFCFFNYSFIVFLIPSLLIGGKSQKDLSELFKKIKYYPAAAFIAGTAAWTANVVFPTSLSSPILGLTVLPGTLFLLQNLKGKSHNKNADLPSSLLQEQPCKIYDPSKGECDILAPINAPGTQEIIQRINDPKRTGPLFISLYGPPGCGKTSLILAIAKKLNHKVVSLNLSNILQEFRREINKQGSATPPTARIIDILTEVFERASEKEPILILLDEGNDFIKENTQIYEELRIIRQAIQDKVDNSKKRGVNFCFCTNYITEIDAAMQSRSLRMYVPLPIPKDRRGAIHQQLEALKKNSTDYKNLEDRFLSPEESVENKESYHAFQYYQQQLIIDTLTKVTSACTYRGIEKIIQEYPGFEEAFLCLINPDTPPVRKKQALNIIQTIGKHINLQESKALKEYHKKNKTSSEGIGLLNLYMNAQKRVEKENSHLLNSIIREINKLINSKGKKKEDASSSSFSTTPSFGKLLNEHAKFILGEEEVKQLNQVYSHAIKANRYTIQQIEKAAELYNTSLENYDLPLEKEESKKLFNQIKAYFTTNNPQQFDINDYAKLDVETKSLILQAWTKKYVKELPLTLKYKEVLELPAFEEALEVFLERDLKDNELNTIYRQWIECLNQALIRSKECLITSFKQKESLILNAIGKNNKTQNTSKTSSEKMSSAIFTLNNWIAEEQSAMNQLRASSLLTFNPEQHIVDPTIINKTPPDEKHSKVVEKIAREYSLSKILSQKIPLPDQNEIPVIKQIASDLAEHQAGFEDTRRRIADLEEELQIPSKHAWYTPQRYLQRYRIKRNIKKLTSERDHHFNHIKVKNLGYIINDEGEKLFGYFNAHNQFIPNHPGNMLLKGHLAAVNPDNPYSSLNSLHFIDYLAQKGVFKTCAPQEPLHDWQVLDNQWKNDSNKQQKVQNLLKRHGVKMELNLLDLSSLPGSEDVVDSNIGVGAG